MPQLTARGYRVVARSWAANLDPADPDTLARLHRAADRGRAQGLVARELGPGDADRAATVEAANHADYPQDPATLHEVVTADSFAAALAGGSRAWGGFHHGRMIGVAVAAPKGPDWWDIRFASVLAEHRASGVGQALAAHAILALHRAGITRISTGGAASNAASRGAAQALGADLEPEWLTLAPSD